MPEKPEESDTPSKTNKRQTTVPPCPKPKKSPKCIKHKPDNDANWCLDEYNNWCKIGGKRKTKKRSVSKRRKTRHYRK